MHFAKWNTKNYSCEKETAESIKILLEMNSDFFQQILKLNLRNIFIKKKNSLRSRLFNLKAYYSLKMKEG
jgi:hypothetical protein